MGVSSRVSSKEERDQEHDQARTNLGTIIYGDTNGEVVPMVDIRYQDINWGAIRHDHGNVLRGRVEAKRES
jgi:hypothetical protein